MNTESLPEKLILASSSKYRKMLLNRLGTAFDCISPEIDETALAGESPEELVLRLAQQKATTVAMLHPQAIVIGSDQVAVFKGDIIGKPGNHETAFAQLSRFSGQVIEFFTAVSVQRIQDDFTGQHVDATRVHFRPLQAAEIIRYLEKEKPYDCTGAFKAESLGIALFERISSADPTALIGLPLIRTTAMLRRAGLQLP
jgi:septum formation protein